MSSRLWSALVQHETVAASRHWPRMHARGARPSFVVLGKVADDPSCTAQLHRSRPRTVRLPHKPRLWGSRPRLDRLPPVRPLEQSPLTVGSCLRTVNRRRYGRGARRSRAATRAKRPSRTPRRTGTPSRSRSRGWPPRRRAAGLPRPRRADAATAASAGSYAPPAQRRRRWCRAPAAPARTLLHATARRARTPGSARRARRRTARLRSTERRRARRPPRESRPRPPRGATSPHPHPRDARRARGDRSRTRAAAAGAAPPGRPRSRPRPGSARARRAPPRSGPRRREVRSRQTSRSGSPSTLRARSPSRRRPAFEASHSIAVRFPQKAPHVRAASRWLVCRTSYYARTLYNCQAVRGSEETRVCEETTPGRVRGGAEQAAGGGRGGPARRPRGGQRAEHAPAGWRDRRGRDVALLLRGEQGGVAGRHDRRRVRGDRAPARGDRLAVGDATAGGIRPTGSRTPPVGDRPDGVADVAGAREPPPPRSGHRLPAEGWLLGLDGDTRQLVARQLRLRSRPAGSQPAVRHRRRARGHGRGRLPAPASS